MTRKWWTLIAVSIATFMLLLDITVVNTALPSIREDLGASFSDLQWVVDAYVLALAALVLTAGSKADRLRRKPRFQARPGVFSPPAREKANIRGKGGRLLARLAADRAVGEHRALDRRPRDSGRGRGDLVRA